MRILYATDGSKGSLAAGEFLRGLSLDKDAQVHIVTVSDAHDRDALLQTARARLEGISATVTAEALSGSSTSAAIEAILRAGDTLVADFILIGAFGHSAVAQFFVGSVAGGVARHAHRSVLMVRGSTGERLESALIGVDSSARSHDVVLWTAGTFPLPPTCALRLVAVVPSQTWTTFEVPSDATLSEPAHEIIRVQTLEEERQRAESWVESLARAVQGTVFAGETARVVTTEVRQGNPVEELIHAAETAGAGLIVVGSQGRTAMNRLLIGSVSERILRHAPCSVLIVRTPSHGERETQ